MSFYKTLIYIFLFISTPLYSKNIHPSFKISKEVLTETISDFQNDIVKNILFNDYLFLEYIDKILKSPDTNLILVDKEHKLSSTFLPNDIINLTDYDLVTRYKQMPFSEITVKSFLKMSKDAEKEGLELFIASTYRSYQFQDKIFTNMKNYHGEEKAATIVAYPGSSQHQLGTAVDFGTITPSYAYTKPGIWLKENSWKYGFTLSYPKDKEDITTYMWEPWHYRYIGFNAAFLQREYFQDIQHLFLLFWDRYKLFFTQNHIQ
ncbi:MAG: M15 family metallopeptidase [Spirochaetaceae bacterium]